jgi:4-hydroxybenzoate polyprenyltransferase
MVSVYEGNPGLFKPEFPIKVPYIRGIFRTVIDLFIFSSLFMGLQGVGMVYFSSVVQGIPLGLPVIAIALLVPFSVYNMNRKTDEEEDSVNHPNRFRFTKRFMKPLEYAAYTAYALAVLIALPFGMIAVLLTLVPLLAGVLYSVPILPKRVGYRRLKEIPVMKNLVVCSSWGAIPVLLPCVATGAPVTLATALCFVFFFSYVFIASAMPDMRDTEGDALSGVRTIPVLIGIEKTRTLLGIMNGATTLVVVAIGIIAVFPAVTTGLLLGTLAYTQGCISSFGRMGKNDLICDILLDGGFVIVGGAFFLLQAIALQLL